MASVVEQQHATEKTDEDNRENTEPVTAPICTPEYNRAKFLDFVLLKAFDIVSCGNYRKFVLKKKDLCESWAINLHTNYQAIVQEIRRVTKYAALLRAQGFPEIATVCMKLAHCVEPPMRSDTRTWSVCHISNVQCVEWVRVNIATDTTPVTVHPRYLTFCVAYWYITRFDHVLRKIIRTKYDKAFCENYNLAQITAAMKNDADITTSVVETLITAITHTHASVAQFTCEQHKQKRSA